MKKFKVTYQDGSTEIIEADGMALTPTGHLIFFETSQIARQNPQGEIIVAISGFSKVEKMGVLNLA